MGRKRVFPPNVHPSKGRDRVYWYGRWYDLGPSGSPKARAEFGRLVNLWAVDPTAVPLDPEDYLLSELCADYLESGEVPDSRRVQVGRAFDLLQETHLATPAVEFDAPALKAWQSALCRAADAAGRKTYSRTYVRMLVGIVRQAYRWGVSTKRVPVTVYQELLTVAGPKAKDARKPREVLPADPAHVAAALPLLRPPVRAVLELMALTAARPDELCRARPRDVLRAGVVRLPGAGAVDLDAEGVWVYIPAAEGDDPAHKTEHHGKPRWVVFGAKAQAVLAPWLERPADAFCFCPRESLADLRADQAAERQGRAGGSGGNRKPKAAAPKRRPGERYTSRAVYHALARACDRAGVPHFSPYQLRHLSLSEIDLEHGLDAAQHVGGHSSPQTTRRYAKRSFKAAAKVAREMG